MTYTLVLLKLNKRVCVHLCHGEQTHGALEEEHWIDPNINSNRPITFSIVMPKHLLGVSTIYLVVRMNDYIKVLVTIISLTHLLIYRVICFV